MRLSVSRMRAGNVRRSSRDSPYGWAIRRPVTSLRLNPHGVTGEGAHQAWHNGHRLIFGATFAVLALASIFAQAWWRAIVGNPLFMWLSVISYNLYLWNCTIVVQCATTGFPCSGNAAPWSLGGDWGSRFFWSYIAISIAIAALVTYGIERPLLRLGTRGLLEGVRQHLPVRT
jgi:peptidoglycan/LPS O-acetylase OafA/YrhL